LKANRLKGIWYCPVGGTLYEPEEFKVAQPPIPKPVGGYLARTTVELYARMVPKTDEQMDMQSMAVELLESYCKEGK
jgi:phage terminase small subunit